jgi:aminoglycoside phosphotransferase (APT) family kinase protein
VKSSVRGDPGVDAERVALRALEGLPGTPRVVAEGRGVLVTELVEGPTLFALRRARGRGFAVDAEVGRTLARLQRGGAQSSLVRRPARGDFVGRALWPTPEFVASLSAAGAWLVGRVQAAPVAARLQWLLAREREAEALAVHGDSRQANVLVSAAGVTFVDWEASGGGDPARDVGMLLADDVRCWLAPETRAERQGEAELRRHASALLGGWEAELGADAERRERVWGWLLESLLRHEFARAHHLHAVNAEVVEAVLDERLPSWLVEGDRPLVIPSHKRVGVG